MTGRNSGKSLLFLFAIKIEKLKLEILIFQTYFKQNYNTSFSHVVIIIKAVIHKTILSVHLIFN